MIPEIYGGRCDTPTSNKNNNRFPQTASNPTIINSEPQTEGRSDHTQLNRLRNTIMFTFIFFGIDTQTRYKAKFGPRRT